MGKNTLMKLVLSALCAVFALTLSGGVSATPGTNEWVASYLVFETGPYAGFGKQMKWASEEALKEINAKGGIAGRPLRLKYHDTALDPSKAVTEMSKVVKESLLIIGPHAANTFKAAMPLAVRENAFCFATTPGYDESLLFQPWTVSFFGPYQESVGPPVKRWAELNPDMKSVVQFVQPSEPSRMAVAKVKREALEQAGVKVLKDVPIGRDMEMGAIAVKAMAQKPDGYVITLGPVPAANVVRELSKRGFRQMGKVLIYSTAIDPAFFEISAGLVDGAYTFSWTNIYSGKPRWQSLYRRYRKDFPDFPTPTFAVPMLYDVIYLAKEAVEQTGVTGDPGKLAEERLKIRNYVRNLSRFDGVMYDFKILNGIARNPSFFFRFEGNQPRLLETFSPVR